MDKLRLLLFEACNRSCELCCNEQDSLGIKTLPTTQTYTNYSEIMLTGGEPMLRPDLVKRVATEIREQTDVPLFMYTARVVERKAAIEVLRVLDGITLTLHEQSDVADFLMFCAALPKELLSKSLQVNYFEGIVMPDIELTHWKVKEIAWLEDCPLPEKEVFLRYGGSLKKDKNFVALTNLV